jgi:hypothetical protein
MQAVIKIFGNGKYYFAREGSVALYIIPETSVDLDGIKELLEATACDQCSYEPFFGSGAFRLWWD